MPVAGGGFDQCDTAQAAVAGGRLLVVAVDGVQAANDKPQLEPMLEKSGALPADLGAPETGLADAGCFSAANVAACAAAGIEPLIAMGRQPHHPALAERFATTPSAPENPTPVEAMAHRLETPEGGPLYAQRKHTPEPVFGIVKSALGFRQFSLRGLEGARRVESSDHGVEPEANVRPRRRLNKGSRAKRRAKHRRRQPITTGNSATRHRLGGHRAQLQKNSIQAHKFGTCQHRAWANPEGLRSRSFHCRWGDTSREDNSSDRRNRVRRSHLLSIPVDACARFIY